MTPPGGKPNPGFRVSADFDVCFSSGAGIQLVLVQRAAGCLRKSESGDSSILTGRYRSKTDIMGLIQSPTFPEQDNCAYDAKFLECLYQQAAATRFRQHIRRSNELHVEYLDDAQLLRNYDRFAHWQLEYLLPFFSDLYVREGYADAIDFTMSDLTGIGIGISSRDRDLERAAPAITNMLPLRALATIATAAEMNARVLKINIAICRCLLVGNNLPARIQIARILHRLPQSEF